ncbi:hypothetical protein OG698_46150 [Streptomyces sp. NBC_01003]|uniref:hypothetical protein n=1 Tax=Streptomyces sp. NBC_01003 TaxID=2903714 RepID=UPI00386ABB81|nr:hypothetical protein OG698_46150 [Streptomyces sp. NBC_01003]
MPNSCGAGAGEGGGGDDVWSEPTASGVCDSFDAASFLVAVVEQQLMVRSFVWPEPAGAHGEGVLGPARPSEV